MANSDLELEEVAINVDSIKRLVGLVDNGRERGNQLQAYISMVHRSYRDQNRKCFEPQVVSIGPIHREHENVQQLQGLKWAYMHDLLHRLDATATPEQILQRCHEKLSSNLDIIKLYYASNDKYSDDDITEMMVTDACFILEFIQKISKSHPSLKLGNKFVATKIFTDLILIENQIPFFVLQDIFDLTLKQIHLKKDEDTTLITLILDHVLSGLNPFKAKLQIANHYYNFKHILEILHKSFQPSKFEPESHIIRCCSAAELDRSGLNFKPNRDGKWALAMEYESSSLCWPFRSLGKPTLRMPILSIHDGTELVLRNLIAYEQSYPDVHFHYFTSFAVAMDILVVSTEDVIKLVDSEIIVNDLDSNEIAAKMINSIACEVSYITFIYSKQYKDLDYYYKSKWSWLRRTYFSNPWSVIAPAAALFLFVLTITQTIFGVLSVV